jgi:hypothetical protein
MKLNDYILKNFQTQKAFADHMEVSPQYVSYWLKNNCIVIDGTLYKPMKQIEGRVRNV